MRLSPPSKLEDLALQRAPRDLALGFRVQGLGSRRFRGPQNSTAPVQNRTHKRVPLFRELPKLLKERFLSLLALYCPLAQITQTLPLSINPETRRLSTEATLEGPLSDPFPLSSRP